VFHAVDAARSQFAAAFAELQCPALKAHHQKIEALPRIAAYRASARCRPFSGDSMM
jgi:glutathione S-transferase